MGSNGDGNNLPATAQQAGATAQTAAPDLATMADINRALHSPVDKRYIKHLPGKNRAPVPYIPWQVVPRALDYYTRGNWESAVTRVEIQGDYAVVGVRLTINAASGESSSREAIASVPLTGGGAGNAPPFEVAERSALKRAAGLFGWGNDLAEPPPSTA